MRDRNPATKSKICPKCGKKSFRLGKTVYFITHYYCYCQSCGYKTALSPGDSSGSQEWHDAPEE
jgi:hypothetical protein